MYVQSPITYLACPYTPLPDTPEEKKAEIMESRFSLVTLISAFLISKGYVVFSPITHSHVIQHHPLNGYTKNTQEQWVWGQDIHFIRVVKELLVVEYEPWLHKKIIPNSKGVAVECAEARLYNIPRFNLRIRHNINTQQLVLNAWDASANPYYIGVINLPANTPFFL